MFVTLKERLQNELKGKLEQWWEDSGFDGELPALSLEESKSSEHGDFACTLALALAKPLKKNPPYGGCAEIFVSTITLS